MDKLIDNMQNRCDTVIKARSEPTNNINIFLFHNDFFIDLIFV